MSGTWDAYQARLTAKGATLRQVRMQREYGFLNRKLPGSLSYHMAVVGGAEQELAILNSDHLNQKTICTLPGQTVTGGALVEWADSQWLVVAVDPNQELYTKAIMLQCNYLLRWISPGGEIVERWSIISDGTKYLTGETISSYNDNGMSLGDSRISMVVARDAETVRLTRANRFLIDDYDSPTVLTYRLTKPFKLGGVYNGNGVMGFVLTEVNSETYDNAELHIADYYRYFEPDGTPKIPPVPITGEPGVTGSGKRVLI